VLNHKYGKSNSFVFLISKNNFIYFFILKEIFKNCILVALTHQYYNWNNNIKENLAKINITLEKRSHCINFNRCLFNQKDTNQTYQTFEIIRNSIMKFNYKISYLYSLLVSEHFLSVFSYEIIIYNYNIQIWYIVSWNMKVTYNLY